ncbi:MAG TPA: DUF1127 domain-containing protein [Candidatus Sulfotelmatobacter sp.]|nr:DUF1127 domain-containing protein [Candidatus Sulfotelmatobacter sp.]
MPSLTDRSIVSSCRADAFFILVARVAALVATWQRRSRERAHLAAMTDRELRDAGLTRSEAMALSDRPFWRA